MSGGPVLVVGAGVGGLSAAIHLAAAGKQVCILEQNPSVGGKMAERRQGGFRWDIGPSVITMRDVLEDAFQAAGRRMEDHISLLAMEPLTRYFYPDGEVLDIERSAEATARRLAELDPREGEAYLRYLAYAARLYRITSPAFIYGDPPGPGSLLKFSPLDLLGIDGLRTMDRSIGRQVFTAHLRQLLDRFATYVGADPYQAPATLNVIAHVELNQGVWFPVGGIYRIAQALTDAAEAMGVETRLGTRVQQILTRGGEVVGVETGSGEMLEAEAVVTDIDAAVVYGDLLPQQPGIRRAAERLRRRERSLSAFILLLGLEGTTPALAHHNLLFSSDYEAEFRSLFGLGATAEDPSLYISISARSNPADAPAGCENWFVLANAPADSDRWRESGASEDYAGRLVEVLARRGFDPRPRMLERAWITPLDLERDTGAWRGALYGASSNGRLAAFQRAHNRSPVLRRLYLAGGTVHPGGGVPMAILSGKAAARMLLQDFARGRR